MQAWRRFAVLTWATLGVWAGDTGTLAFGVQMPGAAFKAAGSSPMATAGITLNVAESGDFVLRAGAHGVPSASKDLQEGGVPVHRRFQGWFADLDVIWRFRGQAQAPGSLYAVAGLRHGTLTATSDWGGQHREETSRSLSPKGGLGVQLGSRMALEADMAWLEGEAVGPMQGWKERGPVASFRLHMRF